MPDRKQTRIIIHHDNYYLKISATLDVEHSGYCLADEAGGDGLPLAHFHARLLLPDVILQQRIYIGLSSKYKILIDN